MVVRPTKKTSVTPTRRLLSWYLAIKLIVVCFFLGGTIAFQLREAAWATSPIARWLVYLSILAVLQSALSSFLLNRLERLRPFIHAQLTWDLLFVLAVIYVTGGVESLYSFLFILVIIAASLFLPRSQLLVVASASAILYGSLLDLQYFGYLPIFGDQVYPTNLQQSDVFYAVFLHVGAFFLTCLLSGALAERLRLSEAAREQREIDYNELESLNETILANINSGLMIINMDGRIRSFNEAASKITGYSLKEVYNRPLEVLFPEFDQVDPQSDVTVERNETQYRKRDKCLTLGYSASRVRDSLGSNLGTLIAFQDLTEYKALEARLKRADRLAAVGRLASGMAHEIRNPLASISGSVQLLLEDENISSENRRLMGIVVREADRLSLLLSDFLNFAKPTPLQKEWFDCAQLIDELTDLLKASGQFPDVIIQKLYPDKLFLQADRQKIRQSIWDLLLNAAEAASPRGQVQIDMDTGQGRIIIEDSGRGVAAEDFDKIFEPFYTTKDKGTGLGLANVYANIEAHKGRVYVENGQMGGARFVIELPIENREPVEQEKHS